MKLTIEIDMDGAAFEDGAHLNEVKRILDDLLLEVGWSGPAAFTNQALIDSNGNTCGKVTVTP